MGRHSCCYKQKLRKGLWSPEEDEKLMNHITKQGHGCWSTVPKLAGTIKILHTLFFFIINFQCFVFLPKTTSLSQSSHNCPIDDCRASEMWQELQAEMDKLPEA